MVVVSYRPGGTMSVQIVYNILYKFLNCIQIHYLNTHNTYMYCTNSVPIEHARVPAVHFMFK